MFLATPTGETKAATGDDSWTPPVTSKPALSVSHSELVALLGNRLCGIIHKQKQCPMTAHPNSEATAIVSLMAPVFELLRRGANIESLPATEEDSHKAKLTLFHGLYGSVAELGGQFPDAFAVERGFVWLQPGLSGPPASCMPSLAVQEALWDTSYLFVEGAGEAADWDGWSGWKPAAGASSWQGGGSWDGAGKWQGGGGQGWEAGKKWEGQGGGSWDGARAKEGAGGAAAPAQGKGAAAAAAPPSATTAAAPQDGKAKETGQSGLVFCGVCAWPHGAV